MRAWCAAPPPQPVSTRPWIRAHVAAASIWRLGGASAHCVATERRASLRWQRAYNVGEASPSGWSEVLFVGTEKEETALAKIQARHRGNKDREKAPCRLPLAPDRHPRPQDVAPSTSDRAPRPAQADEKKKKKRHTASEEKVAVVQEDVEYQTKRQGSVRAHH